MLLASLFLQHTMATFFLLCVGPTLSAEVPGVTKDTIWIGSPGWYSGPGAAYTIPIQQGYLLAVKEINEAGGINGRKIKVRIEDTGYSPKQAIMVVKRLIERDKVFCMIGADVTANMWAMLPIFTEAKIPFVETMASTTIIAAPTITPTIHRADSPALPSHLLLSFSLSVSRQSYSTAAISAAIAG